MSIDVVDLRNFYGQRLGVVARRFIGRGIRNLWRDTAGQRVLGIGYATPYLGLFREEAERCLAFMPAGQGVVKWPTSRPALSALVDENDLPLVDAAVDRVLLVHGLEMTNDPAALLREVWRVLAAGGRLLAVVPNRPWPALFAQSDQSASARDLVHADRMERSFVCAADRTRLVPALGGGVGAHGRDAIGALCRRASGGSDQAGLSRDSSAA
jgi:SAM-dependent methyltransferase